jgi:hypothetical protein
VKISDLAEVILAVAVVGGIVFVAVWDAVQGRHVDIPAELTGFGGYIIGSYFRGRSVNGTISGLTQALANSKPGNAP